MRPGSRKTWFGGHTSDYEPRIAGGRPISLFGDVVGFLNAGRSARVLGDANLAAEHGVLDATKGATTGIETQLGKAYEDVGQAGVNINTARDVANAGLEKNLKSATDPLQPSITSGQQGNEMLQKYAASNPQFNFNLHDYLNSPAMKFQMQQGTEAITNAASAQGLGASGNTLKSLEQYGQGLASTYYDQAFKQAQTQFKTNQDITQSNLKMLIDSGNVGNTLNVGANEYFGGQQSRNTTDAALNNADLQKYLAGLGLQGQETAGRFSMEGAKTAGDFAVGAGNARSAGILGQGKALAGIGTDLGSLLLGGG